MVGVPQILTISYCVFFSLFFSCAVAPPEEASGKFQNTLTGLTAQAELKELS